MPHGRRLEGRRRYERDQARHLRERLGGGLECRLDLVPRRAEIERKNRRSRSLALEQAVDVVAVAPVRRNPARRGVRVREQPEPLELGKLVADGRRRDAYPRPLDEVLGADGLARGNVLLDDADQDLPLALREVWAW